MLRNAWSASDAYARETTVHAKEAVLALADKNPEATLALLEQVALRDVYLKDVKDKVAKIVASQRV